MTLFSETRTFNRPDVIEVEVRYIGQDILRLSDIIEGYSQFGDVLIWASYDGDVVIGYDIPRDGVIE